MCDDREAQALLPQVLFMNAGALSLWSIVFVCKDICGMFVRVCRGVVVWVNGAVFVVWLAVDCCNLKLFVGMWEYVLFLDVRSMHLLVVV